MTKQQLAVPNATNLDGLSGAVEKSVRRRTPDPRGPLGPGAPVMTDVALAALLGACIYLPNRDPRREP